MEFAEVWKHGLPVPAWVAESFPGVERGLGTVYHLQLENGTASTKDFASLLGDDTAVESCLSRSLAPSQYVGCREKRRLTCGTDCRHQSYFGLSYMPNPRPGVRIMGSSILFDPASKTRTLTFRSSDNLAATTKPAVPPPMIMKSYIPARQSIDEVSDG